MNVHPRRRARKNPEPKSQTIGRETASGTSSAGMLPSVSVRQPHVQSAVANAETFRSVAKPGSGPGFGLSRLFITILRGAAVSSARSSLLELAAISSIAS